MIAKASAIQHGQAMTNYATKNNRADIVKTNHLSEGLPPMGMWDEMVLRFRAYGALWREQGVLPMLEELERISESFAFLGNYSVI